jgi:hypothetical protein
MLILWLCWALFGAAALTSCVLTCIAVLHGDKRAHFYLMLAGAFALTFFISLPDPPLEMIGLALLAIVAGALLAPPVERTPDISFDSTASRRRR